MRRPQEENKRKEKNLLENVTHGSPAMTSGEVCSTKKNKSKKRWARRHNATKSNGNLSGVPKDTFSTETSTAALALLSQNLAECPVDPVIRQSQVENAVKENDVLENASDGSPAMTSAEVSLRKKGKRKRRRGTRHDAIESNGNLSGVSKDTSLTETSAAASAMPLQHLGQPSVDPVTRQSQVENVAKEKNVLQNASDRSPDMTNAEVSLKKKDKRKRKRRRESRPNHIESNGNLYDVPKDTNSTETSTAALVKPPTGPAQHSVDRVTRQSQLENAAKVKNGLEDSSNGSPTMTSAKVSLRKKEKRQRRQETRHDAVETNDNLPGVSKDTFSTETSTAALAMPLKHPGQPSVDLVTRQSNLENAAKEKNVLENASDGSPAITSAEVSMRKKNKRKRRQESRPNDIESNGNLSDVPKDTFSTGTSTAALVMPPTHPAQHSVDLIMRQSQVENAAKEKNVLQNASDGSPAMTSAEGSLRKKRKRRQENKHSAIESNGNLSGVPKDTFSTETSIAALTMPLQHPAQHSVDLVMRQSQVENVAKEKNVLDNVSDGSAAMTSAEVSLRKKNKRKRRWESRHGAIESNGNLSGVLKGTFSTETPKAALAMPPRHPAQHSVDPIMRQYQVENVAEEKNVLENASDGSPAMTSAEVSLRKKNKRKRRGEKRHNAIESNSDLPGVPKDTFSTDTSTAGFAMPPQHPEQYSVDPVTGQSQVENAAKERNVLENATDGSPATRRAEVSLREKNRRRRRVKRRLNAIVSNGNLSGVPNDTILAETSTAALIAMPPQYPAQYSVDPVAKQSVDENEGKDNNVLEDAHSRKKNKKRKRQKTRHNDIKTNVNLFGVPKDSFSPNTSTPTLDMPPQHPGQYSMDPVMRQSLEENEGKVQNMIEKAANVSPAMTSEEVNLEMKNKMRKRRKTRYNLRNILKFEKDTFLPETSTPMLDMPSQFLAPYSVDPVMRQCQEENEGKEQNVVEKATDGSPAMTSAEVNSRKKNEGRKRQKTRCNALQSNVNLPGVSKDTISTETSPALFMLSPQPAQFLSMEPLMRQSQEENEGKEQNMLDEGSGRSNGEHNLEIKNSNPGSAVANSGHFEKEFMSEVVKLNTVQGDIADLSLVNKQDDYSKVSHFSLGRTVTSYSKKKLLVLDLNGLLADFVPVVPEGYKPDGKISGKGVFKRPFCDDFLQFCFDTFHVGIWSSRKGKNVYAAIQFLVRNSASKLLFSWNLYHCTRTKFRTIEDKHKPLVLKELRKLWEKLKPGLPWAKGEFNESNTLLLDDSPYKALRNPMHTAIFPYSYRYSNTNDTSLGPGGDIRVYLEGLARAENVQEYVASHPFGQPAITEADPHWDFYRRVIGKRNCNP